MLALDGGLRSKFTGIRHAALTRLTWGQHGYRLATFNEVVVPHTVHPADPPEVSV
jgi:hypothetical protein